ncbi:hypothetical protein HDU80_006713 [Chytriomyces hyalinus]|nr:hypothetical protein HDU80_006713 [Chytriomyces hyalinus]
MPAVTASFVSTSPQQQVEEAAPSDPTSSTSVQNDPSALSVECTPVATQARRSHFSPDPSASFVSTSPQQQVEEAAPSDPTSSYNDPTNPTDPTVPTVPTDPCTPVATQARHFSQVPEYLRLLRAHGVDGANEFSEVSETAEDGIVAPRWNSRLLDFWARQSCSWAPI